MLDLRAVKPREVFVVGELALSLLSGRDEPEEEKTARSVATGRGLIALGADIVDVSAAAGQCFAPSEAAFGRLERFALAVISQLALHVRISVSTSSSAFACAAVEAGASMIYDSSASLAETSSECGAAWVAAGLPGVVAADVVGEALEFASRCSYKAHATGVQEFYVDPGIGRGGTLEQNLSLLAAVDRLAEECPVVLDADGGNLPEQLAAFAASKLQPNPQAARDAAVTTVAWALVSGASGIRSADVAGVSDVARTLGW